MECKICLGKEKIISHHKNLDRRDERKYNKINICRSCHLRLHYVINGFKSKPVVSLYFEIKEVLENTIERESYGSPFVYYDKKLLLDLAIRGRIGKLKDLHEFLIRD